MSWIFDYVKLVDTVSEAPIDFNIWAGISVVSSVLKRNVWINYKTYVVYPNQYIVLVAPPGIGKGEAIHPAHSFAKELKLANYLSDRVTAPRIIERLFQGFNSPLKITGGQVTNGGKDASATLMSSELPTLIGSSDWMLQFLCDAWDKGEFDYDTRNKGSFTVTDMCVSLIGACVPDYIRKINKDANATVSSGFSARTIFVSAKSKSKSLPWGKGLRNDPAKATEIADLESRLQAIANISGEYVFDTFAQDLWNSFYIALQQSVNEDDSDVYKNFKARQHAHVLKVVMALAASESNSLVITRALLDRAIKLVADIELNLDTIFRGVGESDISAALAKLQIYMERKKKVEYGELLRDNIRFINHDDIVKVVKVLELTGFLTITVQGNGYVYEWTGQKVGRC